MHDLISFLKCAFEEVASMCLLLDWLKDIAVRLTSGETSMPKRDRNGCSPALFVPELVSIVLKKDFSSKTIRPHLQLRSKNVVGVHALGGLGLFLTISWQPE